MNARILVAYASKYGSTAEIAAKIGSVLGEAGLTVDVLPVHDAPLLHSYDAVILGSAVYMGQWRKEAVTFLEANEKTLSRLPVWLFSSGPTGTGDPLELLHGWQFPEGLIELTERIKPVDITVFHGAVDKQKLNFFERMVIRGVKAAVGDFRDWNSVTLWATSIADVLRKEDWHIEPVLS